MCRPFEEEPWSSPDTGFEDTEAHDLAYITDLLETRQPAGNPSSRCYTLNECYGLYTLFVIILHV